MVGFVEFYRVHAPLFVGIPQVTPFGANNILWKESQEMVVKSRI
jgi:hypothetical protein